MASQGPITNTSVAATNLATVGSYDWALLDPSPGGDAAFGISPVDAQFPDQEGPVKLLIGGAASGTDQSTGAFFSGGSQAIAYGGAANTWGASPTAAQVNASGFGIAVAVKESLSGTVSHYLAIPFPGFTIPAGATINGIKFDIDYNYNGGSTVVQVDSSSSCTVYYTEGGTTYTIDATAGAFSETGQTTDVLATRNIDASAGAFTESGQTTDVLATREINALAGSFALDGQSADVQIPTRPITDSTDSGLRSTLSGIRSQLGGL